MTKRTYVDANLLIAAWRACNNPGHHALMVLDDPHRTLLVSDALWLEVMPKPLYHQQLGEVAFYEAIFERAERIPWRLDTLNQAHALAQRHGIAAMDAIHLSMALAAGADEFVSGEKPGKPMFRITEIATVSLWNLTT